MASARYAPPSVALFASRCLHVGVRVVGPHGAERWRITLLHGGPADEKKRAQAEAQTLVVARAQTGVNDTLRPSTHGPAARPGRRAALTSHALGKRLPMWRRTHMCVRAPNSIINRE